MTVTYQVWQEDEVAKNYLEGVRGAIPLAAAQIALMLKIVAMAVPHLQNFLDLGCGDGTLGRAIAGEYPDASGVFLDFSPTMLQAARSQVRVDSDRLAFVMADFGNPAWLDSVRSKSPFDAIVSGFAIHHQPDIRKKEIYQEIYSLLNPGGIFLNLEHVASRSQWGTRIFDEVFVDALHAFHLSQDTTQSREQIAQTYYHRSDKDANILLDVESQCNWLIELGYTHVDCYFKFLEIALFGGIRSPAS